jgi:hypothetical protein
MLLFPHLGRPDDLSYAAKRPDNVIARPGYGNGQAFQPGRIFQDRFLTPYFEAVGIG